MNNKNGLFLIGLGGILSFIGFFEIEFSLAVLMIGGYSLGWGITEFLFSVYEASK